MGDGSRRNRFKIHPMDTALKLYDHRKKGIALKYKRKYVDNVFLENYRNLQKLLQTEADDMVEACGISCNINLVNFVQLPFIYG